MFCDHTISKEDHPLGVLEKDFNRVPKGTVTTVAMKQSEVTSPNHAYSIIFNTMNLITTFRLTEVIW